MWSLLNLVLLSWLGIANTRPQTPFFDFKSFAVPASRFNAPQLQQELKSFSPVETQRNNQEFVSFSPVRPENNQEFVSFSPVIPENDQEFVSFSSVIPENNQEFVSFSPVRPDVDQEITRFSPITIQEEDQGPKLAPLVTEDVEPVGFSMAVEPYSSPKESSTSPPVSEPVKMVPFVNLGEPEEPGAVTDAPEESIVSEKMQEKLIKPVKEMQDLPVDSDKPAPVSKHALIQMAMDRLKEMEDKMETMEALGNLKEDGLYVLEPVVEGDVIKVSDHPTMDGMNIIEFEEVGN